MCVSSLTKRIRTACLRYSVYFPPRPSSEDRSLLETDSVCMNHSVGVCICVILCVYMSDFVCALVVCLYCPFYPIPHTSQSFSYLYILSDDHPSSKTSSAILQLKKKSQFHLHLSRKDHFLSSPLSHTDYCCKTLHYAHLRLHNSHPQQCLCAI